MMSIPISNFIRNCGQTVSVAKVRFNKMSFAQTGIVQFFTSERKFKLIFKMLKNLLIVFPGKLLENIRDGFVTKMGLDIYLTS